MKPSADHHPNLRRLEEAADWLILLRDQPEDDALVADWLNWCEATPENFEAFRKVQDTWDATGEAVRASANASRAAIAADVPLLVPPPPAPAPESAPVPHLPAGRRRQHHVRLALAATLLLTMGLGLLLFTLPQLIGGLHTLSTPVAMHGSSLLEDGSRVELGAKSRIRTDFDEHRRRVVVESGEAFFQVTKDAARPFVVEAGGLTVTAIGTAFNVRRSDERVVVTVSEGRVRLASQDAPAASKADPLEASAGEQAVFSARDRHIALAPTDPSVAIAWREGVLKFKDEPLEEVVADLNRYSTRKIELSGPELNQLRYTGTVFGNRLEDWLNALGNVFPVRVEHRGSDTIVIVPKEKSS